MFGDPDAALLTAYGDGSLTMPVQVRNTGLSVPHVGRLTGGELVK